MTMDPASGAQDASFEGEGAEDERKGDGGNTTASSTNDSNDEAVGKKRKILSDRKIEERKAANRKSALESRQRKKALISSLQQAVERLTNENKELRAVSEAMRFQLQSVMIENQQLRMINSQAFQGAQQATIQQPNVQQVVGNRPAGGNDAQPSVVGIPSGGAGIVQGTFPMMLPNTQPTYAGAVTAQPTSVNQPANPAPSLAVNGIPAAAPTDAQPFAGNMALFGLGNVFPMGLLPVGASLPAELAGALASTGAPIGAGNAVLLPNLAETQEQPSEAQV